MYNEDSNSFLQRVLSELELDSIQAITKKDFLKHSLQIHSEENSHVLTWPDVSGLPTNKQYVEFEKEIERFHRSFTAFLHYTKEDPRRNVKVGEFLQTGEYSSELVSGYILPILGGDENALYRHTINDVIFLFWKAGLLKDHALDFEDLSGKVSKHKKNCSEHYGFFILFFLI